MYIHEHRFSQGGTPYVEYVQYMYIQYPHTFQLLLTYHSKREIIGANKYSKCCHSWISMSRIIGSYVQCVKMKNEKKK